VIDRMTGREWLDELARRIRERREDVDLTRVDAATLVLAVGTRGVAAHDAGDTIWLSPSLAQGGPVGTRLEDRVQHLQIEQYGISEPTIDVALEAVLDHLR
jgi:hypothetical protein